MTRTESRTPAQLYSLLFGITLLAVGILGFIANSSFGSGSNVQGSDFIIFEVNGWHNLVHIASGLAGIASHAAQTPPDSSRSPSAPSNCWSPSWASSTATTSSG